MISKALRSARQALDSQLHRSTIRRLFSWVIRRRGAFPLVPDCLAWVVGLLVGSVLKMTVSVANVGTEYALAVAAAVVLQSVLGRTIGIYRHRWRYSSFEEVSALGVTWLSTSAALISVNFALRFSSSDLPTSALAMGSIVVAGWLGASRAIWRRYWDLERRPRPDKARSTIVFGAGEGGTLMVKAMMADPDSAYLPVALLDDDPTYANREIAQVKVEGTRHDVLEVAQRHVASVLLVAIPSADAKLISDLAELAAEAELDLRVLPATTELVSLMTVADVRPPTVDDLLGRDPVEIDMGAVADYLRGRRVLITGAGGSIGSELARQVAKFDPGELYLLDRDESGLHGLQLTLEGHGYLEGEHWVLANIRDRERVFEIFDQIRPEVVFHAAALKHLPMLETHPIEGVKTNVLGTRNLLDASIEFGVDRFVNISTDKAANPISMLGATKLAAERLTAQYGAKVQKPYLSVRFGNVLGSRGSVVPTFLAQIEEGGPVTVTDPAATRYFMTIPEASLLVLQAGAVGETGEILLLDMGEPVRILDLARQLINLLGPGTPIEVTGLRVGEKLHEELVGRDEASVARVHPRIFHAAAGDNDPLEPLNLLDTADQREAMRLLQVSAAASTGG